MTSPALAPVLADLDVGAVIAIVVTALGFLGWLMNMAGGGNKKAPPPPPPARPPRPQRADESLQDQIDVFLQEVGGTPRRRPAPPPRPMHAAAGPSEPVEIIFDDAPPAERRPLLPLQPSAVVEAVEVRMPHLQSNIPTPVMEHLQDEIQQSVRQHLGEFGMPGPVSPSSSSELIKLLRRPEGARHAIIVGEVFGPPKALRRR